MKTEKVKYFQQIWGISKISLEKNATARISTKKKNREGIIKSIVCRFIFDIELFFFFLFLSPVCEGRERKNIHSFLAEWRTKFNIPNTALDKLLLELRERGYSDLPKSSKTLMKTSRHIDSFKIKDGLYCHTGIEKSLFVCLSVLKKSQLSVPDKLILDINVYGINYSKSTNCSLWLIQMTIRGVDLNPCVIGTYYGKSKPTCNDLLKTRFRH